VHHAGEGYVLTASGHDLLKRLAELQVFASRWAAGQARRKTTMKETG